MSDVAWSKEDVANLCKHVTDGLSFSQIGEILGRSRNACIGKAQRLGINRGRAAQRAVRAPRSRRALRPEPVAVKPVLAKTASELVHDKPEEPLPKPSEPLAGSRMIGLVALREGLCKWPIGDPRDLQFRFCGADCNRGEVYCSGHRRLAYVPRAATGWLT